MGLAAGRGGEFFDRGFAAARVAVSDGPITDSRLRFVVEGGYDWFGFAAGHDAVCRPNPRGGCLQPFPAIGGLTMSVGVIADLGSTVELRGLVGGAEYSINGTRAGAVVGALDVAAFPESHVGLVLGVRDVTVPRYQNDHLTVTAWMIGLRVRERPPRP